ncbi:MAG: hypothetical protein FWG82_01350 [Oscillospiraceae bacterium]|nr:hypothetical protein [Oscillospiraceae bacterium]
MDFSEIFDIIVTWFTEEIFPKVVANFERLIELVMNLFKSAEDALEEDDSGEALPEG